MESRKQILAQEEDEGNSQGDGEGSCRQQLWERREDVGGKLLRGQWNERLFDRLYMWKSRRVLTELLDCMERLGYMLKRNPNKWIFTAGKQNCYTGKEIIVNNIFKD